MFIIISVTDILFYDSYDSIMVLSCMYIRILTIIATHMHKVRVYQFFAGFVLQTGIFYFFGFLLFHLAHLFFAIAFPLKAKHFMTDYSRIAHIIEMTIIIVLGSIPGVIIVSTSEYQIDGFLPDLCVPSSRNVLFYTILLPIVISATIGLTILFTAFWILRRVSV